MTNSEKLLAALTDKETGLEELAKRANVDYLDSLKAICLLEMSHGHRVKTTKYVGKGKRVHSFYSLK